MKRELSKDERELTQAGLNRNISDLELIKRAIEQTEKHRDFLKVKREYEDSVRPFNRENEDREIDKTLKGYQGELELVEEKIKVANEHLNEGVEIREDTHIGIG